METTDFLIIGSGIAGLSFAIKAAKLGTVTIVTKKAKVDTATNLAQGGIAAVLAGNDSFAAHIADTVASGAGICDEEVVRQVVEAGPARIEELIRLGVHFNEEDGHLDLGREGGHSARRIAHAMDATGREIERGLLARVEADPAIRVLEDHLAVDLLIASRAGINVSGPCLDRCLGAYILDRRDSSITPYQAKVTLLCTGGTGKVYLYTTTMNRNRIKGYYNQNFSNMYAEMEFSYDWGEFDDDGTVGANDDDVDTFAIMADVGMTMDKLDMGMMFFYASGDDDTSDDDRESAMTYVYGSLGEQFQPYTVLTGRHTGMLSNDYNGANADMAFHGVMSLGVHADFAVTDKLSLNTAIAYAMSDTDELTIAPGVTFEIDDEYGWEIDLGMSYALMDNLTYEVNFGYLMAGDFFEGYEIAGVGPFGDAEDVYVLNHRLSMEF